MIYTRVVLFTKITRYPRAHLTQLILYPPKWKSPMGGSVIIKKVWLSGVKVYVLVLCTERYLKPLVITAYVIKFFDFFLKHSTIPMQNPIIRGVVEVTFFEKRLEKALFDVFCLLQTLLCHRKTKTVKKCLFRAFFRKKLLRRPPLLSDSTWESLSVLGKIENFYLIRCEYQRFQVPLSTQLQYINFESSQRNFFEIY